MTEWTKVPALRAGGDFPARVQIPPPAPFFYNLLYGPNVLVVRVEIIPVLNPLDTPRTKQVTPSKYSDEAGIILSPSPARCIC